MYRKFFICFLLLALINFLVGCYSSELVTVGDYNQIEEEEKPDDIQVITIYSEYYLSDYYIENDTLYGKGKEILYDKEKPFDGKIALSHIESIQYEYLNGVTTALFTFSIVVGIIIIVALVYVGDGFARMK